MPVLTQCKRIDACWKVKMVSDHSLEDFQWIEAIKTVCEKCQEKGG